MPATPTQVTTMRLVVLLAATAPVSSFKLPWSRSAAPKSGGYQLGDISKAVYQTWKDQKDGKATTPAVSDVYDYGYRGRSEYALDMPRPEFKYCPPREMTGVPVEITRACATFSGQMYEVTDPTNPRNEFELSTDGFECNMVLEDLRHESPFGSSQATNPPFAVALSRDSDAVTLICCWRGSTTMEDWAINFAATPVHSASWYDVAPGLRTHGGFLCGNQIYRAFVLNRRVDLHAIDARPARWRGGVGSSPLDGNRAATSSPRAPDTLVDFHTGAYTATVESDITKHTAALCSLIDMYDVTRCVEISQ